MQDKTTQISALEWRWVLLIAGLLATLTLLPYAIALLLSAETQSWQFMGILANPVDGAAYLAKIEQGTRGLWLVYLPFSPTGTDAAAIHVFYTLLGHLSRLIGVQHIVMFHLARMITTVFMYSALYYFGATVWMRLRPRRIFFVLVAVGSGLGWLIAVMNLSIENVVDFTVAGAYPLYSAYANPHFPLAIGCLAILAAVYVRVFRIDFKESPTTVNGGLIIVVTSLVLALVLPQALIPLGGTLTAYLIIHGIQQRGIPFRELRWVMVCVLSALPLGAYYLVVLQRNPSFQAIWNGQVVLPYISPLLVLLGFGLLLIVAAPGLFRALRRFERDADQLMLIWFVVNLVLIVLPSHQQQRLMIGFIIPIAFFAVRAIEDYWFNILTAKWHGPAMIALIVFIVPSNILVIASPLYGVINAEAGIENSMLVERGYSKALAWLDQNNTAARGSVVLGSPNVSLWVPGWSGNRVVYGHPIETLNAQQHLAEVMAFYRGEDCDILDRYRVRYVIVGPRERAIGAEATDGDACYRDLTDRVFEYEDVQVYRID